MLRYLLLCVLLLSEVHGQAKRLSEAFELDRAKAARLVHDGKYAEAEKLLASMLKRAPEDTGVMFSYGYALFLKAETVTKTTAQKKLRKEARKYFLQAKHGGLDEALLNELLAGINEDGTKSATIPAASEAAAAEMRQGEVAFSKRDFASARKHYAAALELDPKLYGAALFLGDVDFVEAKYDEAIRWFERTVAINPDASTAYRYWGDALQRTGRADLALDRYLQAVASGPYDRLAWAALEDWGRRRGLNPHHPASHLPRATVAIKDGKVQLGVDPADGILGMAYGIVRAGAATKAMTEKVPYRHDLTDEQTGLQSILEIGEALQADPKQAEEQKISARQFQEVAELKRVADKGHLGAYIFFVRADAELAKDYPVFRTKNETQLIAYLREDFLGLVPPQSPPASTQPGAEEKK